LDGFMRPLVLLSLLAVGCATAPRAVAPQPEPQPHVTRRALVQRILRYNVRVSVLDGQTVKRTASGVVVGSELSARGSSTYVVTNAHVLHARDLVERRVIVAVDSDGEPMEYVAETVAVGKVPEMDLALLRLHGVQLNGAPLAEEAELVLGDDVVVVAAPFGRALSLSGGMVSYVDRDPKTRLPQMLKTDAPIGYGSSGGGVYSLASGNLLAIVEGYRTAKIALPHAEAGISFDVPMPGETFAAPAPKVRAFLAAAGFGRLLESLPATARR
jgi:serine protease Do